MKLYYRGKGTPVESVTGETFVKCKTVMFNGINYVWPPPGKAYEWKRIKIYFPHLVNRNTKSMHAQVVKIPVVTGDDPTKAHSFVDLRPLDAKRILKSEKQIQLGDLMTEEQFFDTATVEEIDAQIKHLETLKPAGLDKLKKKRAAKVETPTE